MSDKPAIESARSEIIKIAAEMLHHPALPSSFIEDWDLPKSTPLKTCRKIIDAADKVDEQCKRWAVRLRSVFDSLQ